VAPRSRPRAGAVARLLVPLAVAAVALLGAGCSRQPAPAAVTTTRPSDRNGWRLVWWDDFDGTAVDARRWTAEDRSTFGDGNEELACLLDRPANVSVARGVLHLTARREPVPLPCGFDTRFPAGRSYSSAMLTTATTAAWTYGRFEVRARTPTAAGVSQGLWPAFWLRPVDEGDGELDVMEILGSGPSGSPTGSPTGGSPTGGAPAGGTRPTTIPTTRPPGRSTPPTGTAEDSPGQAPTPTRFTGPGTEGSAAAPGLPTPSTSGSSPTTSATTPPDPSSGSASPTPSAPPGPGAVHQGVWHDYTGRVAHQGTAVRVPSGDPADGMHVYAVEWRPQEIRWYIDGRLTWSRDTATTPWLVDAFTRPFYLRLNLAVGGTWPGAPDRTTRLPASLDVDWVRVYQPAGARGTSAPTDPATPTGSTSPTRPTAPSTAPSSPPR